MELSKGGRALLKGRRGEELDTTESKGQMLQRVMPVLMGMKNILVLNDEAHHCYRDRQSDEKLKGDERKEAEKNNEAARLWISGLEAAQRKLGLARVIDRTRDVTAADNLTDQDLLREVMNTVGKQGRLGEQIRCVVSVSMLTEGWDANTVTHVLGIRAFGTQLLCEQVVGRALRRQSYDLNEDGLFDVEYADVLGVPFDFTAKPVVVKPQPPRPTVEVRAIRPDRDALEIRFPRVAGYRVELPEERLTATFDDDSTLVLTPDLVGPSVVRVEGIIGEGVDLTLERLEEMRPSTVLMHLTKYLLFTKWRDPGGEPKLHLFGQLKRITRQWLGNHLECKGGTYPAQLMYLELADIACNRITAAITAAHADERPIHAILDPYNPAGSTSHVRFTTSRQDRWQTDPRRCHVNWVILDSDWEAEFCRVAEAHSRVCAYVKNHGLGLEVPYRYGSESRRYLPDFIVLVDDGRGEDDPLGLRRVHRRLRDPGRLRGEGRGGVRGDDRGGGRRGRGWYMTRIRTIFGLHPISEEEGCGTRRRSSRSVISRATPPRCCGTSRSRASRW